MHQIKELPVERDEYGYWTHPEFYKFFGGRERVLQDEVDEWLESMCMELEFFELEYDEESPVHDRYFELGDTDISEWEPTSPEGEGWFIVSIHETDSGPFCVWMREAK